MSTTPSTTGSALPTFTPLHLLGIATIGIALLVNSVAPYVGLKFEYSYTMFANLETDMSNHWIWPSHNVFGQYEYYVVERIDVDGAPTPHVEALSMLLERLGHPAIVGDAAEPTPRPILGDVIRYHLELSEREGLPTTFALIDAFTGERHEISSTAIPDAWRGYSLWSTYPVVLHSYTEIHDTVRDLNTRGDRRG